MTLTARQRAKRLLSVVGVDSADGLWVRFALRRHEAKLAADPAYREWCETVGWSVVDEHWGHDEAAVQDEFARLHLASQLYELTELLRARIGTVGDRRVLDAGASDGLFLQRIGATDGVGLNFLEECAAKIRADGFEAVLADIERTPFADGEFDTVICCETLEHVPNPVATLNELARVCRGRIHLTIPWLPSTRINSRPPGWPETESHIFEFSERDFERMVSHANVEVVHRGRVQVFAEPANPVLQAWLKLLMYPNFFPKLQYYELEPKAA